MLHISKRKLRSLPFQTRLRGLSLLTALLILVISSFFVQLQVTQHPIVR
jgi:hypothetical protein